MRHTPFKARRTIISSPTPGKLRKVAAALLAAGAISLVPVSPAGAQNPAYPPDTYIANVLTTGYDAGQGAYLLKVVNYYGLGIIQGAWSDPTWGVGLFAAWFDFCDSNYSESSPNGVGAKFDGLVVSSTNPVLHEVNNIAFTIGAETHPGPPILTGLLLPGEAHILGPHTANAGYAFIGPMSC